jgi:hypothetical protein
MTEKFESHDAIPELIKPELLIPQHRQDIMAPKAVCHTQQTTTPREASYIFFNQLMQGPEHDVLNIYSKENLPIEELFDSGWGNHVGRVLLRVVLDPQRLVPIDMRDAYEREVGSAVFSEPKEADFFYGFTQRYGVVDRTTQAIRSSGV